MSDGNMRSLTGLVVGTAGHIDHGKTSLVYALTGIDTDRLKEEKQRGISIDLGFAQMQLPDGRTISFVDVPGHERFVRNMLAGAAGMEAVLLIVAANEAVMPQTREHFEICRLLGLRHGLVVLTKIDLATAEQLANAKREVKQMVAGSFLEHAPMVEVSAITKAGLPELGRKLAELAAQESGRDRIGVMRMPVDRGFALKGFGTVVTGTLLSGVVTAGETLELLPGKQRVRVRGLQSQHSSVQQAAAGQRVAVNLTGVDQHAVKRGQVLAAADTLAGTRTLDVELHWLDTDALPGGRELFILHAGTAETGARITLLDKAGDDGRLARLRLSDEVIVLPGDRFVVRRPSPAATVGGGVIIEAFPPKRLNRMRTVARLSGLRGANVSKRLEILVSESVHPGAKGRAIEELVRLTGAARGQVEAELKKNAGVLITSDQRAVTRTWVDDRRKRLLEWLRDFHNANPNAAGAPLAAARMGLDAALAALVFQGCDAIRVEAERVALTSHRAQFTSTETAALQKLEQSFRAGGFQPPSLTNALAGAGTDVKKARALLETLVKGSRLIRLPGDLIFHADVIAHIRTSLAQQKGRRFSVVEFKEWTNISRKFAIPLLEYLDQQRVTKRDGDFRTVL